MILHLVLIRFKPGTSDVIIRAAEKALLGLQGRVPEIRAIRWGPNFAPSATEYPWVLAVELDDMAAVDRYLNHPLHLQAVAESLAPFREARLAVDVEQ